VQVRWNVRLEEGKLTVKTEFRTVNKSTETGKGYSFGAAAVVKAFSTGDWTATAGKDYMRFLILGIVAAITNASSVSSIRADGRTDTQIRDIYCAADDDIADCVALVDFYQRTGGTAWREKDGWLSRRSYCEWAHLECEVGRLASM
jgi:hypothetical protein